MNELEPVEVRLNDVCRACLSKTENMICFNPKTEETSHLIALLSFIGNCEIEINEILPNSICKLCEEKLKFCYDFKILIQHSNDIIQQCLNDYNQFNAKQPEQNEEEEEEAEEEEKMENSDEMSEIELDDDLVGTTTSKQRLRQLQVEPDRVEEAINSVRRHFFTNNTCIECGFVGGNTRALSIHMTHLHKEMKETWCPTCNKQVEALKSHVHDQLTCQFCTKTFNSKGHYIEHLRGHSNRRPFKCHKCSKCFISSRHLNNHLRIHANNRPFKCPHCPKNFVRAIYLKAHLKEHRSIMCQECNASFDTHESLDGHICGEKNDQTDDEIPARNFCKQCRKRVRSLSEHEERCHAASPPELVVLQKDPALCTHCGKQFKTISKLNVHMRGHTGELPYKCQHCEKKFANRNQVVVHERVHTGEKPFVCYYCGKAFSQSSVLTTHMRMHTGRPEGCKLCKKRFCRPAQLRLHMREHTGEKPYECTVCELAFKQKSHLAEHARTHSADRPYKCSYCDRGFKQSSSLKSHLQIHLGKKPFKCSQCSYACRQSYSLTQHMKMHAVDAPKAEKPHICAICERHFNTVAMLRSHVSLSHERENK